MVTPTANFLVTSFKSPKLATFAAYLERLHISLTSTNFESFNALYCYFNVKPAKFMQ